MKSFRIFISVFLLSILPACLQAQTIVGQARIADAGPLETNYQVGCRDSAGNHYITGITGGQGESGLTSGEVITQKVNSAGTVQWTGTFAYPPESMCYPTQITVDSTGEVSIAGYSNDVVTNTTALFALRISNKGANLWFVHLAGYSGASGLAIDSALNMYIAAATSNSLTFIKLNGANGATLWTQPQLYGTSPICNGFGTSSSGKLFALLNGTGKPSEVASYNEATGAILWTRAAAGYGVLATESWSSMVVLNSGNVAASGSGSSTGKTFTVATVDWVLGTTGAFQYRQVVGTKAANFSTVFSTPLSADSSNDVFWLATETDSATKVVSQYVGKYSSSGVLSWYRATGAGASSQLISAADDGGMFASYVSSAKRGFTRYSSAGAIVWSVVPATGLIFSGGQIVPDAADDLSYMTGYKDAFGNTFFGLLSLAAANGAVLVNGFETPNGDRSNSIVEADQDSAGNSYVTGSESRGWYVSKLSPAGAVVWRKTIPQLATTTPVFPSCICYSNGEIAVAGSGGPSPEKLIVAHLDATTGAVNWTTVEAVGQSIAQSIRIDPSGNVDVGLNDFLSKYGVMQFEGTNGVLNWQQSETADTPLGIIALDSSGDIYLTGSFWFSEPTSTALTKLTPKGVTLYSTKEFYGTSPLVSSIQCDPATGDVFLESSDSVTVGANAYGAIDVGCYDPSGVQKWFNSVVKTGYNSVSPTDAKLSTARGLLFMVTNLVSSTGGPNGYGAECLNASNGVVVWQKIFSVSYNLNGITPTPWVLDQYGDPIFTGGLTGQTRALNRFQTIKLDAATGATRFQVTYNGTFASTFNYPTAITVGPDDEPLIWGQTASPFGPGSNDSFVIKYADAHAPICVNDAYTCVENTALPTTDPSVFANDRDISGATCHLVAGPTHAKTFSISTAGKITYTPAANFKGTDTFTYDATNAYGTSNVATVTITVS